MNYIVIANKVNGVWNATIYDRTFPNFDYLLEIAQTQSTINLDNYNVVEKGVIISDNIEDIEPTIRQLGFRKCDICGAWVTPQDRRNGVSTFENGIRKCASCIAREEQENRNNRVIRLGGYHSTSDDVRVINADGETFDLSNVLGVGIEMEVNANERIVRNGNIKVTEDFYKLANPRSRNRIFRCEEDGTVQAEIISNIFTKKSLYDFDWSILTDELKLLRNDESVANVGFHVHLSKLWLGNDPKTQALNFLKLQYFLKSYEDDCLRMSGRKRNEMRWCSFYEQYDIESMKNNIVNCDENADPWHYMPTSHGYALIASGATIELRIGKSTNDPERVKHYLRFVLGMVENIKNVPFSKCYCIRKVTRLVPDETMNYWRKQGCFLRTNAIDERGVTL